MLLAQLAQVEQLLLQLGLRCVVVLKNGGEGSRDESEGRNARKHNENAKDSLKCRARGEITIADGRDRCNDKVATHNVEIEILHVVEVGVVHPG